MTFRQNDPIDSYTPAVPNYSDRDDEEKKANVSVTDVQIKPNIVLTGLR